MKTAFTIALLSILCFAGLTLAQGPKLAGEKLILADDDAWKVRENAGLHSMKLSPDAKHLLYFRKRRVIVNERDRPAYRVVLREVASGKDVVLPVTPLDFDDPLVAMLSMRPFDASGTKVVLGAGLDANDNGLHEHRTEKMEAVVYDIAKGRKTSLPIKGDMVFPTFDRTGKGLVVMTANRAVKTGKLYTTALENVKLKEYSRWGFPRSLCPTADVLPMLLPPEGGSRPTFKFVLYDLAKDEQIAEPPLHERNTKLDDYNPQWTANGRYLCYVDLKVESADGRERRKLITRIWDRVEGKEYGIVDGSIPVGPGPGKTTIVLVEGRRILRLHDVASGKSWPLGDEGMRVIAAQGKYMIYARSKEAGDKKPGAYLAEIVPPAELKAK